MLQRRIKMQLLLILPNSGAQKTNTFLGFPIRRRFVYICLQQKKSGCNTGRQSVKLCLLPVLRQYLSEVYFSIFISVNFRKKEQKIQWRTPSKIQWREIEGIQSQWTLSFGINGCVSAVRVPSSCFPNLIFNNGLSSFRRRRCFF